MNLSCNIFYSNFNIWYCTYVCWLCSRFTENRSSWSWRRTPPWGGSVTAGFGRPTLLSLVQIQKNIIWICYGTCIFFKFRIHSNIYTRYSQEYSYNITRIHISHSKHEKFNSQIVYSQQYSQHRSKIQYWQHRSSIFTLFPSISIDITVQRPNLS
jgi:hypothetical protein